MTEAELLERIESAAAELRSRGATAPKAVVSVAGWEDLGEAFEANAEVRLTRAGTQPGAEGPTLRIGTIGGVEVVAVLAGAEDGRSLREKTLPIRVARRLGAEVLIATTRAQVLNSLWPQRGLMLAVDHINMLGSNPLVGANADELGARFPDMSEVYDGRIRYLAEESALARGIQFVRGVYIARAAQTASAGEAVFLRGLGGDAVGSGMVPEAIVAVHGGMRVLGLVHLHAGAAGAKEWSMEDGAVAEIIADVIARI